MLTLEDCLDFTDLAREEIDAIAEHEHLSEMAASAVGNRLAHSDQGIALIRRYIREDIESALSHGDEAMAHHWEDVLSHFDAAHSRH